MTDPTREAFELNVARGHSKVTPDELSLEDAAIDAELRQNLEEVADLIADRLELAIVQRVPQALLDAMVDGMDHSYNLPGINANYGLLRFCRRGNLLEFRFELNNQRAATFRFAGDQTLGQRAQ